MLWNNLCIFLQSGTVTWLPFLSCCIFSRHNQLVGTAQEDQCWRGNRSSGEISPERFCQGLPKQYSSVLKKILCTYITKSFIQSCFCVFQSCQSLEDHLLTTPETCQPYLLAIRTSKAQVFTFYIVLDKKLLPCQSCTSLGAKVTFCLQCEVWWCPVQPVHISVDNCVQYWHRYNRWNTKS